MVILNWITLGVKTGLEIDGFAAIDIYHIYTSIKLIKGDTR
jgi:hypothetical protein